MEKRSVVEIVRALNGSGVRYLIAGGLAVVAHGYLRFTADIDIILDLQDPKLPAALAGLSALGYKPRAPVPLADFADAGKRSGWRKEKGLTVFSLSSAQHPATEIDLFIEPPLDFEACYRNAARQELAAGVIGVFLGFEDLVRVKRGAARPRDLDDIEQLKKVRGDDGKA